MTDPHLLFRVMQLNAAYAACLDSDRLESWPDFFSEPCLYKVTTADNVARNYQAGIIYADSLGMLRDRISALREANIYERQRYRHIIGTPCVLATTDDSLTTETSFMVVRTMRTGDMDLFIAGMYRDTIRIGTDGTLLFAERIVICDSQRFDTLVAIPL